jgi:hypothetical protein
MTSSIVLAMLEAAMRALLLAITVYSGLRFLRVGNVLAQKTAWGLVLAASFMMPLLMRWHALSVPIAVKLPGWLNAPQSPRANPSGQIILPVHSQAMSQSARPPAQLSATPDPGPAQGDRFPAPTISFSNQSSQPPDLHASPAYGQVIASPEPGFNELKAWKLAGLFYLAISAVLLFRLLYGLGKALRIWWSAQPVFPEESRHFACSRSLRSSKSVSSPVTIGSAVVLPARYAAWDAEKLRIVLAHERSHIRQGDFYLQVLAGLYTAIFWFSPLGWWLKRKLSELGEAISDRAGIEEAASRASYAQILLEFAALPLPTLIGVAMASTSNLSHRIERLLNESSFRQAFADSRRRALLAILLVPVALFVATALVRVEAAGQTLQPAPSSSAASITGQEPPALSPDSIGQSAQVPAAPPAPESPAAPALSEGSGYTAIPEGAQAAPPPPLPPDAGDAIGNGQTQTTTNSNDTTTARSSGRGRGYSYADSSNGDSWSLVTDPSQQVRFSGDWHNSTRDAIEKVRSQGHEKFLVFTHNGKSYFLDDPAVIAQIEAMYKPMEALGRQQEELGKQQEELGKQQEELGRKQEMARVPTPDMSKEMAELNAAVAKLQAKKGSTVSQEELGDLENKIGNIQGKLGDLQGKIGEQQGKIGELQGKLGEQQGKLGAEQGRLGAEQGRIAQEADHKVRDIIGQSLNNGKAKPVD